MLTGSIIVVSVLFQFATVYFAIRLMRTTGGILSWIFISLAISLMGIRRIYSFAEMVITNPSYQPDLYFELLGLVTSVFMLGGIVLISPLFESIRHSSEKLKESEQRLFKFLEKLPVGVFVVSSDGKPYYENRLAADILGKEISPEIKKERLSDFYKVYIEGTDELYPADRQPVVRALSGESSRVSDMEIRKPEGGVVLEAFGTPIYDDNNVLKYAVAAFTDISERKQAEKERERLIAELQKAVAEIRTLRGILPVCAWCRRIRDDEGYWKQLEIYVSEHSEAEFTHGICPECFEKLSKEED